MPNIGFYPGEILLPNCQLETWSVVACDQYTSQPEYWQEVGEIIAGKPSAGNLIFPEAFLEKIDFNEKISQINDSMYRYLKQNLFTRYPDSIFYVERTLHDGSVRKGLLGLLDLEEYDYRKDSRSLVRATEGTVLARIPARVKIRENAPLEIPHILVLIDDPQRTVIEPIAAQKNSCEKLYDFDLMMNGGHITGWRIERGLYAYVADALAQLANPDAFTARYQIPDADVLLYAVGDGNHSLAAAKECWENIKEFLTPEEQKRHPARYALVELNNLHDESLQFEAIHRAAFVPNPDDLVTELEKYASQQHGTQSPQTVRIITQHGEQELCIPHPERTLAVGSIQDFLDQYFAEQPGRVDYIHGEDVIRDLAQKGAVGILLPAMQKDDLFKTVLREGALPRKTFSMGEANDKRYYLECRQIR
ncbi:MAG: DUF1015 domain-containing protein [Candidatus Merdivicinus sp.]|jgi:hypothetical protein